MKYYIVNYDVCERFNNPFNSRRQKKIINKTDYVDAQLLQRMKNGEGTDAKYMRIKILEEVFNHRMAEKLLETKYEEYLLPEEFRRNRERLRILAEKENK